MVKNAVRRALAAFGYEIVRAHGPRVRFDNFVNLALAYEHHLAEAHEPVTPNARRPQLLARLLGTPPSEAYFIVQSLARCRHLGGDVCEFGVAQGETSALIANEILGTGAKHLHLFDSFKGLPKPTEKDQLQDDIFGLGSIDAYAGRMASPEALVRRRLAEVGFPESRYTVHKGFVDHVLRTDPDLPKQVVFAYVDFDFYEPIRQALGFLHTVMPPGAIVIVDDFDFFSTGAKTAVEEFLSEHNGDGERYDCFVPDARYGHFAVLTRRG